MTLAPRCGRDDAGDRLEAARAGHFEVEQDDVDPAFAKRFDGVLGGSGDCADFERRVGFDHARQDGASDRRIVDDHQADLRLCWRGSAKRSRDLASARSTAGAQATPTS